MGCPVNIYVMSVSLSVAFVALFDQPCHTKHYYTIHAMGLAWRKECYTCGTWKRKGIIWRRKIYKYWAHHNFVMLWPKSPNHFIRLPRGLLTGGLVMWHTFGRSQKIENAHPVFQNSLQSKKHTILHLLGVTGVKCVPVEISFTWLEPRVLEVKQAWVVMQWASVPYF